MTPNSETPADLGLLGDILDQDLIPQEEAAVVVDLSPALTVDDVDVERRLDGFEQELRQWKKQIDATFDRLAAGSHARGKILRCSIVKDAHQLLLKAAGPRQAAAGCLEHWDSYVMRVIEERGREWFQEELSLPVSCLALLFLDDDCPFEEGSRGVAHHLRTLGPDTFHQTYLEGVPDGLRADWAALFELVSNHATD